MKTISEITDIASMENQIICGDCLQVMKLIPDKSVDLVLTDPPYGMSYVSSWRKQKHEEIDLDDNLEWVGGFLKEIFRVLKDDTHAYVFCNDYAISEFRSIAKEIGFTPKRTLVWVKNNHTSGDLEGDYANKTEFILYLHKGRKLLNGGRDTNVLFYDRENCESHPTIKPVQLLKYLAIKSSNENDLVLDPFLGSGTTARACKDLGRRFIGIEISEKYCSIAEERLKQSVIQLK